MQFIRRKTGTPDLKKDLRSNMGSEKPEQQSHRSEPSQRTSAQSTAPSGGAEAADRALEDFSAQETSQETSGGNLLLLRFLRSEHFTPFLCVAYMERYADNIGIHAYLCRKFRTYKYEDVEFFIPQLIQLLVTVETESMALEDLVLDLCSQHPHYTLLTFWQLQAHIQDLAFDPQSYGFQVARRILNKLQYILFNVGTAPSPRFRENTNPAVVASGAIAAALAVPALAPFIGPLAHSQGRKQRSFVFQLASKAQMLAGRRKSRSSSSPAVPKFHNDDGSTPQLDLATDADVSINPRYISQPSTPVLSSTPRRNTFESDWDDDVDTDEYGLDGSSFDSDVPNGRHSASDTMANRMSSQFRRPRLYDRSGAGGSTATEATASMPNLLAGKPRAVSGGTPTRHSASRKAQAVAHMSLQQKIKELKTNYFRCSTQFAIALQSISIRLAQVPKDARLSALRIEIAMLNTDLPAEVDIPSLLPRSAPGKLHRIVRIAPGETAVLNSAERVPFLLFVEYLRDDLDFEPSSEKNLSVLLGERDRTYVFDLGYKTGQHTAAYGRSGTRSRASSGAEPSGRGGVITATEAAEAFTTESGTGLATEIEADLGDMAALQPHVPVAEMLRKDVFVAMTSSVPRLPVSPPSEPQTDQDPPAAPRGTELSFQSTYTLPEAPGTFSTATDLATHMRIAAIMLNQLETGSSGLPGDGGGIGPGNHGPKLSPDEIASIRAKIIANMKTMQDHAVRLSAGGVNGLPAYSGEAGQRRLENDMVTGGMLPSAPDHSLNGDKSTMPAKLSRESYMGEDWEAKRDRIRAESPFGHCENWELCSVIAKTGDDLRQEAFACQLIEAMSHTWERLGVPVWVRKMKMLITSANTGLVETIVDAPSIHSLKKALTAASIECQENPKGNISTLSDHFRLAYGERDSPAHQMALDCFVRSLAAYSIICYILQIKDRHNGNLLLDSAGHIIHIDFGFLLSNSPGSMGFEAAPFKLTMEYVELMGGTESKHFKIFTQLMKDSFKALRKDAEAIIALVEMMQRDSSLPCFSLGQNTSAQLRQRFQLQLSESEVDAFVEHTLIQKSLGSIYTRLYDQFQLLTQGIYS